MLMLEEEKPRVGAGQELNCVASVLPESATEDVDGAEVTVEAAYEGGFACERCGEGMLEIWMLQPE